MSNLMNPGYHFFPIERHLLNQLTLSAHSEVIKELKRKGVPPSEPCRLYCVPSGQRYVIVEVLRTGEMLRANFVDKECFKEAIREYNHIQTKLTPYLNPLRYSSALVQHYGDELFSRNNHRHSNRAHLIGDGTVLHYQSHIDGVERIKPVEVLRLRQRGLIFEEDLDSSNHPTYEDAFTAIKNKAGR